jgi:antitoxin component YwqK of YwqJK toxin-antitoxin module
MELGSWPIRCNTISYQMNKLNEQGEQHGPWEGYYRNGNLSFKGNYVNGKKHGSFETYHSNGNLSCKGNYLNDKRHGPWEGYYYDGKLYEIRYYIT